MGQARRGGGVALRDWIDSCICADGGVADSFAHGRGDIPFDSRAGGADDCNSLSIQRLDAACQSRRDHVWHLDTDDVSKSRPHSFGDKIFHQARMTFILDPKTSPEDAPWGGKGRALYRLSKAGFNVPQWFAVSPDAHGSDIGEEVRAAAKALAGENEFVAVRSSASDEDGSDHSFAGQLESFLYVRPEDVPNTI